MVAVHQASRPRAKFVGVKVIIGNQPSRRAGNCRFGGVNVPGYSEQGLWYPAIEAVVFVVQDPLGWARCRPGYCIPENDTQ